MRKKLRILLMSDAWATLALGLIGPIYAVFVQGIGGDILDASWAYLAFMITSGIMIILISRWEDRFKHKEKLVVLGYSLNSLGCLFYIFVNSQAMLVLTQIILGIAEAVLLPAYDSIYSDSIEKKKEASQWGAWESMWYIVTAISAVVGGYIASGFGFKTLFVAMFVFSIFGTASSLRLLRKKQIQTLK